MRDKPRGDFDSVIVFCGLVSIGIATVYWLMRIGFDDPVLPIVKSVCLALFIFTFPSAVSWTLFRREPRPVKQFTEWWRSYPFLWLAGIALTAFIGRLVPIIGFNPFPVLAAIGAVAYAIILVVWLTSGAPARTFAIIAGCGAFAVWASGVVWGRIYKNPLFYENFILDGKVHHDSLALAALGNMLRTYHVASAGIDGLNYFPYHWGTPWLFAQWSNLLDAQVLDFYQLGFPVTMIPFFFGGTLAFAVAMRNRRREPESAQDLRRDFRLWFVFLAACIGIIPISGLDSMGVWTSNLLISESYTVAVPCALMFLATVLAFYDGLINRAGPGPSRARSLSDSLFVLIGIPLGIVLLGYLKISLMALAFAVALYALARFRLWRRPLYLLSAVVTTIVFYVAYTRVSLPAHREGIVPFDFLWSVVQPAWWPFFLVVHLFWSWLYILVRLRSEGIGTVADLKEAAAEQRIIDVEVVALVAILGIGPGLVVHIDGGSAFYFSDVQRWLAVGFILSRIPTFIETLFGERNPKPAKKPGTLVTRFDSINLRAIVVAFLVLPMVGSMLSNSIVWPSIMIRANADTRHALYPANVAATIPFGFHGFPKLRDPAMLADGLRRSPNVSVADGLRRLSALPQAERQRTALFIPQDQNVYWNSLTRPGACTFQSFVAPAFASMAMIDGMPHFGCTLSKYYGIGSFTPRTRSQGVNDRDPAVLCRRAKAAGMDRVIIVTFDVQRRMKTTALDCPSGR
jgi:hypothetical protein